LGCAVNDRAVLARIRESIERAFFLSLTRRQANSKTHKEQARDKKINDKSSRK
jgi:hypothetical protein